METKRGVRHISNVDSERLIHSPVSLTLASIIVIIIKQDNGWMNTCISHPEELEDNNANTLSGGERLRDEKTGTTEVTFRPTVYRMYAASRFKQKYNLTVVMGTPVYYITVPNPAEDVFSRLQHHN
jgi:hypothetical protein